MQKSNMEVAVHFLNLKFSDTGDQLKDMRKEGQ